MQSTKSIMLTIIVACQLMVVLDSSVMVTALPEIGRTLHLTTANLTWVQNAYILAYGGFMLLGARAGDIMGRRRIFRAGIALFTVASLLAGMAQSAEFLLAARALQGLAAAMATPSTLALLSVSFVETKERSKAIAIYSAVSGGGGSVGLILGGMLTEWISWRVGMFINVPIGIALLIIIPKYLQETQKRTGHFDLLGAVLSVTGMTSLVFGFVQAAAAGWQHTATLAPLAAGIVLMAGFVAVEARAKEPIIPLRLFSSRERSGAYLGRFLFICGNFSLFFFIPQFLQNVLGFSSFESGLAFVPFTGVQFGMMYVMPSLVSRFGSVKILISGLVIAILGTIWCSQISTGTSFFPNMFLPLILMGIGAGMVFQPLTAFGLTDVDPGDSGAASGLINVAHQIGASMGLAVLSTVFESVYRSSSPSAEQFAHAASIAVTGSAVFLTTALLVTLLLLFRPAAKLRSE